MTYAAGSKGDAVTGYRYADSTTSSTCAGATSTAWLTPSTGGTITLSSTQGQHYLCFEWQDAKSRISDQRVLAVYLDTIAPTAVNISSAVRKCGGGGNDHIITLLWSGGTDSSSPVSYYLLQKSGSGVWTSTTSVTTCTSSPGSTGATCGVKAGTYFQSSPTQYTFCAYAQDP